MAVKAVFDKCKVKHRNGGGVESEGILPFCSGGCCLSIPAEEVMEDSSVIVAGSQLTRANNTKKLKKNKQESYYKGV